MLGQFSSRSSGLMSRCSAIFLAALMVFAPVAPAMASDVVNGTVGPQGVDWVREKDDLRPFVDLSLKQSTTPASAVVAGSVDEVANSVPLSPEKIETLLKRLPPLGTHDKQKFSLPEQALVKPPKAGVQILDKFPPEEMPTQPRRPQSGSTVAAVPPPLKILRVSPQGSVASAEQIAVTFSQPMVPLAEAKDVNASSFLTLQPQPAGNWRWAGTQTLIFTPGRSDHRLPAATTYTLTFPARLKSTTGGTIDGAPRYTFKTPTIEPSLNYPPENTPTVASPVIVLSFEQDIDKNALLPHLSLRDKTHGYGLRLATAQEIAAAEKDYSGLDVKSLPANGWIAVKPLSPLPLGTHYQITVLPGSPSAEGPDKTTKTQSYGIDVHGRLLLTEPPKNGLTSGRTAFAFGFNNGFASDSQKVADLVKINPRPAGCEVAGQNNGFNISGDFKAFQKYTVTIDGAIKDCFNQKLGHPISYSWTTGARDTILSCNTNFVTIAPGQKPVLGFFAQATDKVTVKIYKVAPADLVQNKSVGIFELVSNAQDGGKVPGKLVDTKTFPVGIDAISAQVDFAPYLKDGHGQFVVVGSCPNKVYKTTAYFSTFVQVTGIGIDAFRGKDKSFRVFTSSLIDGKPLAGCRVSLLPSSLTNTTDSSGQVAISFLRDKQVNNGLLTVSNGSDCAVFFGDYAEWSPEPTKPTINWYCVTDRALYRPGDEVHVKGWQRGFKLNDQMAIRLFSTNLTQVAYAATSQDGTKVAEGKAKVDEAGGFDFAISLPAKINLGELAIEVSAIENELGSFPTNDVAASPVGVQRPIKNYSTIVQIGVQEFRRPEFEMKTAASKSSIRIGEVAKLTATASYFGGGSLPQTKVDWHVTATPWVYTPPNWSEYNFGGSDILFANFYFNNRREQVEKNLQSLSDGQGASAVDLCVNSMAKPTTVRLDCSATFTDVNRQQWTDRTEIIVHPSKVNIGVKAQPNLPVNDHVVGSIIVVDVDGKPIANTPVQLLLRKKMAGEEIVEVAKLNLVSTDKPLDYSMAAPEGESFELVATAQDDEGKPNTTITPVYVSRGFGNLALKTRDNEVRSLTITADKPSYTAGDTAKLTVSSPIFPAHGMLLLSRSALLRTQSLDVESATTVVSVPVTSDDYPGLMVEAVLNGKDYAFATGQVILPVPPVQKKLSLTVKSPSDILKPGSETTLALSLRDSAGSAVVGGHIAVAVVDESVFALRQYRWADPLDAFYPSQAQASLRDYLRRTILLNRLAEGPRLEGERKVSGLAAPMLPGGGDAFSGGKAESDSKFQILQRSALAAAPPPPPMAKPMAFAPVLQGATSGTIAPAEPQEQFAARINFNELALFAPDVVTGEDGKAVVKFKLPDSTTKYRIMAAAVSGDDKSGLAESTMATRMDLAIKPSLPRFLNFGDKCDLPFVVQNQTDKTLTADVVMRAACGTVKVDGRTVQVPANSRVEVRFPVEASAIGTLDVQCAVVSGDLSDAAILSLPVMVPATIESFAAYGQVDKGSVLQKLDFPRDIFPQVGNLTVTTSSTALESLADAYLYLRNYRFDCSEQLSSKMLAMLALHDSLASFGKLDGKDEATFRAIVDRTIKLLVDRQNIDGSFGLWKKGEKPNYPYVALQVSRALYQAKSKGYAVPPDALAGCKKYLVEIDRHLDRDDSLPVRAATQAYALNVRSLQNDVDAATAHSVLSRVGSDLNVEIAAWLLPVFSRAQGKYPSDQAKLREFINNSVVETASTASTRGKDYGRFCYRLFYSPLRQDGLVLSALIVDQPQSEIIAKLAKGLLARRKNGAWDGTQENWVVLDALDRYFAAYEKVTPDFTAHEWLNEGLIGSQKFAGRTTESHELTIPTEYLLQSLSKDGADEIAIAKEGPGRLYYRVGIEYAPKDLQLKAKTAGFIVSKTYEGVDSKEDVKQDKDGVWHFKAGASVRCKVHFDADGDRYHVALMSPLPGGCEPVNAALAGNREPEGGGPVMPFARFSDMWWSQWYEHQNMRDHQAEVFSSLVGAGGHDYDFVMRATAPGRFVVPPTKIEEMYQAETFGRTASETVVIE